MRGLLIAALLIAAPAHAEKADDYIECMVGKSAAVLHAQGQKDQYEALEIAYDLCGAPEGIDEAVVDYVNLMVERMAAE